MGLQIKKDTSKCIGCYNDFYNYQEENGCWSFENMTLIKRKEVHIDQRPPWTQAPKIFPSCYRKPKYVYIDCEKEDRQY